MVGIALFVDFVRQVQAIQVDAQPLGHAEAAVGLARALNLRALRRTQLFQQVDQFRHAGRIDQRHFDIAVFDLTQVGDRSAAAGQLAHLGRLQQRVERILEQFVAVLGLQTGVQLHGDVQRRFGHGGVPGRCRPIVEPCHARLPSRQKQPSVGSALQHRGQRRNGATLRLSSSTSTGSM